MIEREYQAWRRLSVRRVAVGSAVLLIVFFSLSAVGSLIVGFDRVAATLSRIHVVELVGFAALWLGALATRLWRWWIYAKRLGYAKSPRLLTLAYVTGYAFTATPGRLGEVARLWVLSRRGGIPYRSSAPALLADRINDALCVVIMCLVGAVATFTRVNALTLEALAFGCVLVILASRPRLIVRLVKIAYQATGKRGRKLVAKLCFVVRRLNKLLSSSVTALVLPVALAGWFAEAVLLSWIVGALGGAVGLLEAAFVVGLAMLAGSIPFLPGGLGGVELTMIALLGVSGVSYDIAVSATVLFRLVSFWFAVALGWACVPAALGARWSAERPPARVQPQGEP